MANLSIFGLMSELNLNPSYTSFRSLCRRVEKRRQHLTDTRKKNIDRRTHRQRLMRNAENETFSELKEGATISQALLGLRSSGNLPRREQTVPEREGEEGEQTIHPGKGSQTQKIIFVHICRTNAVFQYF